MAGVRGDAADLLLPTVEGEGVRAFVLPPEGVLEPLVEPAGRLALRPGPVGLAEALVELRHARPRVVHVALELARRERQRRDPARRIDDRVAGVLPALVVVATRRAPGV